MIKLEKIHENDLEQLKIFNENTGEYISVVPKFGANINQIVLSNEGTLIPIMKGNYDLPGFSGKSIFKGAHLIPFPNRIKDGKYNFNGNTFELEKNYPEENNAAHGFIYDKQFEIEDFRQSKSSATLIMKYIYNGDIPGYPFKMEFVFSFTLDEELGFVCNTEITNLSGNQAPVGVGWHPFLILYKQVDEFFLRMSVKK